jgi:asparagine synthase (glutamine-hydrolysing)
MYSIVFGQKAESKRKTLLAKEFMRARAAFDHGLMQKKYASLQTAMLDDITHQEEFLRMTDRASSAFSMECRRPFLDHRLVEFGFSLPSTQKIRNGWTKYVMRNAMKGYVPEVVRRKRQKSGTPIPQQRWMKNLQGEIRNVFTSPKFRKRGIFNQSAILKIFDRYCEGSLTRLEREYYREILWRILNVELWFEIFIDRTNENTEKTYKARIRNSSARHFKNG